MVVFELAIGILSKIIGADVDGFFERLEVERKNGYSKNV